MIPLWGKLLAAAGLLAALGGAATWAHHEIVTTATKAESDRRDKLDKIATDAANVKVAEARRLLAAAQVQLTALQSENQNAQIESNKREANLRAGNDRLRVLVNRKQPEAGQVAGGPAAGVDTRTGVVEDLAPAVAGNLESLRRNENTAIDRLNACIVAYDTARAAIDTAQK